MLPTPPFEVVGAHNAECATHIMQLEQTVRTLEAQLSARQRALDSLSECLVATQSELSRVRGNIAMTGTTPISTPPPAQATWSRRARRTLLEKRGPVGALARATDKPFVWLYRRIAGR